jgi:PKD repeat protein
MNSSVELALDRCNSKSRIKLISWFVLIALLTLGTPPALAQSAAMSAPSLNTAEAAFVPDGYNTSAPTVATGAGASAQPGFNATLFGEPEYGTVPLTVDFLALLTNAPSSIVYEWNFGDGSVSSLPATTMIPHVYQRAGTYLCSLVMTASGGRSTTAFVTIVVRPSAH